MSLRAGSEKLVTFPCSSAGPFQKATSSRHLLITLGVLVILQGQGLFKSAQLAWQEVQYSNRTKMGKSLKDFVSELIFFKTIEKLKYFQQNRSQPLSAILIYRLKCCLQPPFVRAVYYNLGCQSYQHSNPQILPRAVLSLH